MEIKENHIVITGTTRGIGYAFSEMLAREKCHLTLVNRKADIKDKERLSGLGALSVKLLTADLQKKDEISDLIIELNKSPVDILINNAGLLTGGLLENQPIDDIYSMFHVNLISLIHLTHGILPGMILRKKGKIVNNASVSGVMNIPCASTYSASKAGVVAFTNSLRAELKGTGVSTLLLITPGIKTKMFDQIDDLYGAHVKVPLDAMPPHKYAQIVKEAILEDIEVYKPSGTTGIGLTLAQHVPIVFDRLVSLKFHRS